jgi:hypothetical protein
MEAAATSAKILHTEAQLIPARVDGFDRLRGLCAIGVASSFCAAALALASAGLPISGLGTVVSNALYAFIERYYEKPVQERIRAILRI